MSEFISTILAILIVLLPIALIVLSIIGAKERRKKKKELGAKAIISCVHVNGLSISQGSIVNLYAADEKMHIQSGSEEFEIPTERLRAAEYKTETEIIEKQKNVVGRAMIGNLFLGPVGAVVGGMTGLGSKKKKGKRKGYLIINYINNNGDLDAIMFVDNSPYSLLDTFARSLNKIMNNRRKVNGVTQL